MLYTEFQGSNCTFFQFANFHRGFSALCTIPSRGRYNSLEGVNSSYPLVQKVATTPDDPQVERGLQRLDNLGDLTCSIPLEGYECYSISGVILVNEFLQRMPSGGLT